MSDSDVESLERIEREAWRDLAAAAPPDFAAQVGLETHEFGGALMLMASRAPVFQFNWLSGAGLTAPTRTPFPPRSRAFATPASPGSSSRFRPRRTRRASKRRRAPPGSRRTRSPG